MSSSNFATSIDSNTQMSDFEMVCQFNKCFDFPVYDDLSDEKCLRLRLDLIEEELSELRTACIDNDVVEEQDACADILYVAYGMAYTYKINSDVEMNKYTISKPVCVNSIDSNNSNNSNNLNGQINQDTLFMRLVFDKIDRQTILNKLCESFDKLKTYAYDRNIQMINLYLHDIIYYTYNFQHVCNYDSDKIFKIVHASNMSKLCQNETEAQMTVDDYKQKFDSGNSPYDSPYYYKLDNGLYVIKNKSSGKALKNINYVKVKLV